MKPSVTNKLSVSVFFQDGRAGDFGKLPEPCQVGLLISFAQTFLCNAHIATLFLGAHFRSHWYTLGLLTNHRLLQAILHLLVAYVTALTGHGRFYSISGTLSPVLL